MRSPEVQRLAWTDERVDDLARRMDAGFERVDRDIRDLKHEVGGLRSEMTLEFRAMRTTLWRAGGATIVALAGTIAAFLLGGS